MKTLKLIAKANGKNYFFGEINAKGQELIATFESAKQMHEWFSKRSNLTIGNYYINQRWMNQVINNEYSQSRSYYSRMQFDSLEFCTKIFNQRAK